MPEHYTSNTNAVLKYCPTCNKKTMHRVYNKRLGTCMEDHVKEKPKQEQPAEEPSLF